MIRKRRNQKEIPTPKTEVEKVGTGGPISILVIKKLCNIGTSFHHGSNKSLPRVDLNLFNQDYTKSIKLYE